jgi:DNA-binding CsgD family transcriptional regulator
MTDPTNDVDPGFRLGLTGLLIAIATWGVVDLALDRPEHWLSVHVLVEVGFVLLSLGSVLYLWMGWVRARRSLGTARDRLSANQVERDQWKARAERFLHGLGAEIDAQFERWSLTPAERQVAMLLLKGLGHKEVAALLTRSERTVRQHAVSVYRKSSLAGRAELPRFFSGRPSASGGSRWVEYSTGTRHRSHRRWG